LYLIIEASWIIIDCHIKIPSMRVLVYKYLS
jgi:hypothetical protein